MTCRMLFFFCLMGSFLNILAGCATRGELPSHPPEIAQLQRFKVEIGATDMRCLIKVDQKSTFVELKPPCYFIRSEGRVLVHTYPESKVKTVTLIAGDPVSLAEKKLDHWRGAENLSDCSTGMMAILILESGDIVLRKTKWNRRICRNNPVDEKEFWTAAHHYKDTEIQRLN